MQTSRIEFSIELLIVDYSPVLNQEITLPGANS